AFAIGVGVGMNARLSRHLGAKNFREANRCALHGLLLSMIVALIFALFGTVTAPKLVAMQTSDPEIIREGVRYLNICFLFSIGICGQICMERLLQSTGLALYSMYTQLFGAVLNIILDPFLIFGWGFFPEMGVTGAAIATVTGQILAFFFGLYLNMKRNREVNLKQD
ncbi:MAG: MATE family efflux transporter, partial [Aedoeadaptatus pacaensis]